MQYSTPGKKRAKANEISFLQNSHSLKQLALLSDMKHMNKPLSTQRATSRDSRSLFNNGINRQIRQTLQVQIETGDQDVADVESSCSDGQLFQQPRWTT